MTGRAFAICGPSGVGKDTLIAGARAVLSDLHIVRRAITRPASAGGEEITPLTEAEFDAACAASEFVLHWRAHGLRYGIPRSALAAVQSGRTVVFNGSRAMLEQAAQVFPGLTVVMVTAAPEVLAARLAARGRESAEQIAARMARTTAFSLPPDLPVVEIANDRSADEAIRALVDLLQPSPAR